MSGIEVAGLVLGSIPLVISALEHYHDGLVTIQRWRKHKYERKAVIRNLMTEQVKMQNVCEKLLIGLVAPSQIETMIKDPFGSQWEDVLVARKLKGRLYHSTDVLPTIMSDMRGAITEMMRRLDIDPNDQVRLPSVTGTLLGA